MENNSLLPGSHESRTGSYSKKFVADVYRIWDSHSSGYKILYQLGYNAM
jgi:hypothetical protein